MTVNARPDEARQLMAAARRDHIALTILARDPAAPLEITLFLAQQAVENAFKAALALQGIDYRRTHDLLLLESLTTGAGLRAPIEHSLLARLGPYAVEFRYLGSAAPTVTLAEAERAVAAALAWVASMSAEPA
jgi:HEPN domain-containing protein